MSLKSLSVNGEISDAVFTVLHMHTPTHNFVTLRPVMMSQMNTDDIMS